MRASLQTGRVILPRKHHFMQSLTFEKQNCEHYTYSKGAYNVILAGAAFMDRELVFEAYSAPENAEVSRVVVSCLSVPISSFFVPPQPYPGSCVR